MTSFTLQGSINFLLSVRLRRGGALRLSAILRFRRADALGQCRSQNSLFEITIKQPKIKTVAQQDQDRKNYLIQIQTSI